MANLDNVRLFVIDALKKYHGALTNATDNALTTTLSDYVSKTEAGTTYLSKADAATTYLTKADAASIYVVKEAGKGLSTEDFTTAYMTKLDGIAEGAEVNVQSDWSVSDSTSDAFIANKPNIAGLFGYAYYDSSASKISFSYSSTSGELYSINCSDFIIDGMIDSVSIEDYAAEEQASNGISYLFIDFNTAAENGGHTDIKIPLKDIFNPSNYYDKTTVDSTFVKVGEETSLSLGTAQGSGTVISSLSVSGHQITATYTNVLTAETQEAISLSGTKPTGATNRTAVVTDIVASGTKNHTLTISYANVVTSETQLSMSGSAPGAAGTGKAKVISELTVSDHTITASYTEVLTQHQSLTDYVTKTDLDNAAYLTSETQLSLAGASDGGSGKYVSGISVSNHQITVTYTSLPNETNLSLASVTKPADAGTYTYVLGSISTNGHEITPTYVGVLKEHQDISGKEDTSNKKTSLTVAANISDTYYPSTSAVASYIGSLAELTSDELASIFATS